MRCPKCHYLSFEPEPRCRNCGYDFSLADADSADDLSMRSADEAPAALADFELHQLTPQPSRRTAPVAAALDAPMAVSLADRGPSSAAAAAVALAEPAVAAAPPVPRPVPSRAPTTTTELPLFVRGLPPPELPQESRQPDPPLALVPPAPRPPLSVRRRTPDSSTSPAAASAPGKASPFSALASSRGAADGKLLDSHGSEPVWAPLPAEKIGLPVDTRPERSKRAGPGERLLAALVDAVVLGAIDAGIVWFTLKICALTIGQARVLPLAPLGAFCVLLDVGYMLLFTVTSGQTLGKMAAGIRVIAVWGDTERAQVSMRQAMVRELWALPSLIMAGLGYLPALLGRGPAVHDRIAHTRVVRT